ncbi:hypothetical protein [Thermococcus sp.]|uniref:hypothetical protein n=1 Tax=Thermococcus sp. TaxID=35749 RepID=UPI002637C389|nr:hypothetical protein [Thermococcus sp.]
MKKQRIYSIPLNFLGHLPKLFDVPWSQVPESLSLYHQLLEGSGDVGYAVFVFKQNWPRPIYGIEGRLVEESLQSTPEDIEV